MAKALLLFSGGQDSAICLAQALRTYPSVETVGFDYGQRHDIEMTCRRRFLDRLRRDFPALAEGLGADHCIDMRGFGAIADSALTRDVEITMTDSGLPSTFVPGRNLAFFVFAAAVAYRRGADILIGGMCETDYSGYPDCRAATLDALQTTLRLGLDRPEIAIETPLMHLDKAQSWSLAESLAGRDFVELVRVETHSCYRGARERLHEWGYGCATCPACQLRAAGWRDYAAGRDGASS